MNDIIKETSRLQLRKITPNDAPFFVKLVNTAGWIRFIGNRNVHSNADAIAYLERMVFKTYAIHGYGHWLVQLKETMTPIGMCGFMNRETLPGPDLGFAFLQQYEGKGYASEAAAAVLQYGSQQLKLKEIYAIALEANKASIAVLNKAGLHYESKIMFGDPPEELMLFNYQHT